MALTQIGSSTVNAEHIEFIREQEHNGKPGVLVRFVSGTSEFFQDEEYEAWMKWVKTTLRTQNIPRIM